MSETKVYIIMQSLMYEREDFIHKVFSSEEKALKYLGDFKACGSNSVTGLPQFWILDKNYTLSLEEETCY